MRDWRPPEMSEDLTPYALAAQLQQAGARPEQIVSALEARGLDQESIGLLLSALGSRDAAAPLPQRDWEGAPAAPASGPAATTATVAATVNLPCARCGVFLTPLETERVLGKDYCRACAARPEVNYPRAFRDRCWGKRDAWAWFFGLSGLLSVLVGGLFMLTLPLQGALFIINGVGSIVFWNGVPVGRALLLLTSLVTLALGLALDVTPNVLGLVVVALALRSTRTKLFFRLEVPDEELAAAWRLRNDNQVARYGLGLGLIAVLTTVTWLTTKNAVLVSLGLAVLALVLGGVGLTRVDPKATPPIGRKGQAIAALVLGALVAAGAVAVYAVRRY